MSDARLSHPGSRPVLARLARRLGDQRKAMSRAAWSGALAEAFALHLVLATAFGALSALDPWQTLWPKAALAAWCAYLWPLACYLRARRRADLRLEAIAAGLDRLNPEAPDVFRTLLSTHRHDARTLDALEILYASWEPRLAVPAPPTLSRLHRGLAAFALALALGFPVLAAQADRDRYPGGAAEIYARAWLPLRALSRTPLPRLTPVDLPEEATAGDTVRVRVHVEHVPAGRPVHAHLLGDREETRYSMERRGDTAHFRFGPINEEMRLRFSTAGFSTRAYRIRKVPPPRLQRLAVVVTPPPYARRAPERYAEAPPLLTVLPGSVLAWEAEAAAPLSAFIPEFGEAGRDLGAGERYVFRRRAVEPFDLRLRLVDGRGAKTVEGPFRIELKPDAPPEISLLQPADDQDLGRALRLPVHFRAQDDFGISGVSLRYAVSRGGSPAREGSENVTGWLDRRAGAGAGSWDASPLGLESGDEVELWLEATDNDAVSGPKTARSASVRLRLPSREEVRAAAEAQEREAAVSLSSALEREKRLARENQRPDKGATGDASLQPMPEWELQRILSDQPRRHLQETKRQIQAESRRAEGDPEAPALRELLRELEAQEKRLPPSAVARASAEEQRAALESLNRDQKALDQRLAKTPSPRTEAGASPVEKQAARETAEARERLRESLERNLRDQQALREWMAERERVRGAEAARREQVRGHEERMRQDMERALEQIDQSMQKGLENGTLSPEMLEKMERVRELIEEVLDADEKNALRESARGEVEAGELRRAMEELLSEKDGVRESLEGAIRMLEALKETRALRDLAADVRELGEAQQALAAEMESAKEAGDLAAAQKELAERLDAARAGMERMAKKPGFPEPEARKQDAREAREAMQKASEALGKPKGGDRQAAKQGADLAARKLRETAEQMEKALSKRDAPSDAAELRAALEETLEFSRWLGTLRADAGERRAWGGEAGARQSAVGLSRWLAARWKRLAQGRPFDGDVLRREAAAMVVEADALAAPSSGARPEALDGLRRRAQGAARELLKWLNEDKEGGGSEEGDGEGDNDAGGGESGDSGNEGMAGRLKGASARQNAVNQATQELLQSFLRQRQSPGGSPGQGSGGGSGSRSGSRGSQGGESGEGGGGASGRGAESGGEESQGGEGSGRGEDGGIGEAAGLANRQQQIGEALEHWAESADDAGGAARKLRQLAAEARELEAALRGRRLSPEDIARRQERFRTRLLEAAHALEERGRERERRAEAYQGGALAPAPDGAARDEERLRALKRRRAEALKLPLTPAQKRRVEWYYDQLLNP